MGKNKKIIIAGIIVAIVIILCIGLVCTRKEKMNNQEMHIKETVETIENENMKVTLSDVATVEKYIIIEYDVELKNNIENTYNDYINGIDYILERDVKIDRKIISTINLETEQLARKISENQIKVYDVIETDKISDIYKLEVDIYDSNNIIKEEFEKIEETSEYDENIEEINENETEDLEDNYEEVTIDSEEYFSSQEYTEEKEYDDIVIEDLDESRNYEEKLGTLQIELKKQDTETKANIIKLNKEIKAENITTEIKEIIETNTAKIIIADTEQKNITEKMVEKELKNPEDFEINIQDENGNTIDTSKKSSVKIYNENGEEWYGYGEESATTLGEGTAKIKTIIGIFNKEIKIINLQPIFYRYITNEENENLNNKTWYEIKDGVYINTNKVEGTIEVFKIKNENNFTQIYFNKKGLIPSMDSVIIMRNKENEDNQYIVPRRIYKIDENEYIAEFQIGEIEYEDSVIHNIEDAEFSIIEHEDLEKTGEKIMLEI